MQFRRSVRLSVLIGLLLLTGVIVGLIVWRFPEWLGMLPGSEQQNIGLWVTSVATLAVVMLSTAYHRWGPQLGRSAYRRLEADDVPRTVQPGAGSGDVEVAKRVGLIKDQLRQRYGYFWRQNVRLLLVVGEPAQIEAIAPGLAEQRWLEGQGTVLLWGGSVQADLDQSVPAQWRGLSQWRLLDGVVWALNKTQSAEDASMNAGVRKLQRLALGLHWQLPLYLWQVCNSAWPQDTRKVRPVGCVLPTRLDAPALQDSLTRLLEPLRREGLAQMNAEMTHDFLLRLSRDLQAEGIARLRHTLAPLIGDFARGVPLRGLWFSLPVHRTGLGHDWPVVPEWGGVLADKVSRHRLGWSIPRTSYTLALSLAAIWSVGMLLSLVGNRAQIAEVHTSLSALQQSKSGDDQLLALDDLVRELARLDYRAEHGVPWYQRFGLSQNQALLDAVWPRYVEANNRLLRDSAAANLQQQLNALLHLPAGSSQRAERTVVAYEQLKAYLMMARPQKADAAFLANALGNAEPSRSGVSPGVWRGLVPNLWQFYAEHLAAHPDWAIKADPTLVAQTRQVLLGQLGQRNAEASLYRQVLERAASHHPELSLQGMTGDTDGRALFSTQASVPGVFTRQAWEGQVRQAIEDIAEARREEIDWVLSDNQTDIAAELTPDVLRERLTERYFQDYASAWLDFLNSLRWHQSGSLAEVIEQLTLMTDVRQSPLIALMNTLAYQGQAGTRRQALADSLLQSAQKLVAKDKVPVIDQLAQEPRSPLDATFGPLLTLLGKDPEGKGESDRLSLQAFLTRVTRVRLKLQQVSNAPDPQEMTQALAQTVFQGKSVDLTDTQSYGSLIAASLGAEWGVVGETLFVQPLEQAWQRVLQPSAAGLNRQWQRAVVTDWQGAFAGRYPFAATASDASLPMLGQMIRADSGRIEQFLQRQLNGVLRKEGSRWVADPRHSQALRFNPQFLAAINQLSQLADVLYTDGGMGLSFGLQGKPVRDIVQTTFVLNGEQHQYFNQKESWQRFNWPGVSDHPGTRVTWISVRTGERLFGDYQGTWGLIRLLEKAQITSLNDGDSHYQMVLKAADGLDLTWHLRTELGAGPLALLKLRNFVLPQQIFLNEGSASGVFEG
ncbi:MAG: ImcF-related family protein [Pseudomonas sp.]